MGIVAVATPSEFLDFIFLDCTRAKMAKPIDERKKKKWE
jgi:hypothetical protein